MTKKKRNNKVIEKINDESSCRSDSNNADVNSNDDEELRDVVVDNLNNKPLPEARGEKTDVTSSAPTSFPRGLWKLCPR